MIPSPTHTAGECETGASIDDPPSLSAEQVAIHYIDRQLEKARRSLRRTRTCCLIALFLILGYMGFITITLRNRLLRPDAAAEMAAYYFSKFAAQTGPGSLENMGEPSRESVTPNSGQAVAKTLANPKRTFPAMRSAANSDPLGIETEATAYVHRFISRPHGNIQDLIHEAQHPKTVQQLGDELDAEIRQRLPSRANETLPDPDYMSYVLQKVSTLSQLELQLNRLAQGNNLTPYERALRRVIASTMGSVGGGS